jgi:hypothetical protein
MSPVAARVDAGETALARVEGRRAVPCTRNPKKMLPLLSAVSGVLIKIVALKAAALAR